MRFAVVALLLALVVVVPALADEPEPYVRDCGVSVLGDLGQGWQERAIVAGHVSFVGLKNGYQRWRPEARTAGRSRCSSSSIRTRHRW